MTETNMEKQLGSIEWWNDYFSINGGWEKNGGREQTRIFAEMFSEIVKLEANKDFSLLDVGCALGEALKVFQAHYPQAKLHGIDISPMAISRCRSDQSINAQFIEGTIDDIKNNYDVIYVSNVLEHFSDFRNKATKLISSCNRLCIMVPFKEMSKGKVLSTNSEIHHQHTFFRESFDYLIEKKLARKIDTHIISCPGAWGWTKKQRIKTNVTNLIRTIFFKSAAHEPLQIVYDIIK